jgi:hypothetical protein
MDRMIELPRFSELTADLTPTRNDEETRVVTDASGVRWRVAERVLPLHWRGRERPALVFETRGILRTVADFPADWRALPDPALARLADRA